MDSEPQLTLDQAVLSQRSANEGIPIAAIARILHMPFDIIASNLRRDHNLGIIGDVPRADWPPGQHWDARLPTVQRTANIDDVEFACKQVFKLTNLEAGFLMVLLRYACAEKDKLHGVIEQQRLQRQYRPNAQETTDPKMVDVMICKLRKKLKDTDPMLDGAIQTSWGKGYFIAPETKAVLYTTLGVSNGLEAPEDGRATTAAASA